MENIQSIDELQVSFSWKEKFKAIATTEPKGDIPAPKFNNMAKYKALPFFTKYNLWAFFFSWLYYFLKGMPKKGMIIFALTIVLQFIGENLNSGGEFLIILSILLPAAVGFAQANVDYYRKMVLNENFWW